MDLSSRKRVTIYSYTNLKLRDKSERVTLWSSRLARAQRDLMQSTSRRLSSKNQPQLSSAAFSDEARMMHQYKLIKSKIQT